MRWTLAFLMISVAVATAAVTNSTKPAALRPGDTVGFISPASYLPVNVEQYRQSVISAMSNLGLNVRWAVHAFDKWGYLAGTDQERSQDVMDMFKDPSVKAIVANRGGWGCNRIIDMLDYSLISQNPKILMGFSDLTGLINAVHTETNMLTFHGPCGVSNWTSMNSVYFKSVLMLGELAVYKNVDGVPIQTIRGGKARGKLIGGNLSVFTAMIGSKYLPAVQSLGDSILFLEEVGEDPYRVDRMLTQLHLAGFFNNVRGVVFGRCTDCGDKASKAGGVAAPLLPGFSVFQVLTQKLAELNIPSFYGAMFGHINEQFILPVGLMTEMDADAGTITMLEPAVSIM